MSPTLRTHKGFRLYFFSREERRMRVHAISAEGEAKFWLEPRVEIALNEGLRSAVVAELNQVVEENADAFRDAWQRHFGS